MYDWRKMTTGERVRALEARRARHLPWHSPPHLDLRGTRQYLISATCYEHRSIVGESAKRMSDCEAALIELFGNFGLASYAWCVLPNHYHFLIRTADIKRLRHELGKLHGRSAHAWNGEDNTRGRKVWFNYFEKRIKSDRHFWATLNYVHHNPVHHGYVERWQDWPWSSVAEFLAQVGRERAVELWERYPILDYGKNWDGD